LEAPQQDRGDEHWESHEPQIELAELLDVETVQGELTHERDAE
jgi:hypothetical protein